MNTLTGKTIAVLYNSTLVHEIVGAALLKEACADTTIIDLVGMDDTAIGTAIATLGTAQYDKVYLLSQPHDTGATARPSYDRVGSLRAKLKTASLTTHIEAGTSAAGAVTTITLEATSTASTADNYYNSLFIESTGGDGAANPIKYVLDYTGSTKVLEVGGAAWTSPGTNTTYKIYNETNIFIPQATGYTDATALLVLSAANQLKSASQRVWEAVHTGNTMPVVLQYLSPVAFSPVYGTSSAGSTTSLTYGTGGFGTADHHVGSYVYLNSGTAVLGQYAKIASHTDTVLTLEKFQKYPLAEVSTTWTSPSTVGVFRIANNIDKIFWDLALTRIIPATMYDITDPIMWAKWQRLLNNADDKTNLDNLKAGNAPETDYDLFRDELIQDGLAICAGVFNATIT